MPSGIACKSRTPARCLTRRQSWMYGVFSAIKSVTDCVAGVGGSALQVYPANVIGGVMYAEAVAPDQN